MTTLSCGYIVQSLYRTTWQFKHLLSNWKQTKSNKTNLNKVNIKLHHMEIKFYDGIVKKQYQYTHQWYLIEFSKEKYIWDLHLWDLKLVHHFIIRMSIHGLLKFVCNPSVPKSTYMTRFVTPSPVCRN